ncbi:protein S100-A13 [Centropristis striata]|uniref:protein S100-A13 n=1 Tax=Centropristis striata TaxID=184440 RepID=UPI0027DFC8C7|nr:protein S100-A13 [Centropristis striata]
MEGAIKTLVTTFLNSSRGKENLDSGAFNKLVKKQLGGLMENASCSSAVKEMQMGLDANQDGKISFGEYLSLIGSLANSYSEIKTGTSQDAS